MAEKLFYSMGEVAEMFDVNASLIRHWESQFSILRPKRNKKGNRLFSPEDVENLKMIYHLVKERGMTLEGAKKALRKYVLHLLIILYHNLYAFISLIPVYLGIIYHRHPDSICPAKECLLHFIFPIFSSIIFPEFLHISKINSRYGFSTFSLKCQF